MTKKQVWRKTTTRYTNATTGRKTTKDDPQGIRQRIQSKRLYGTLKASDGRSKQVPLTEDETSAVKLLRRLQTEADHDRAIGITPHDRRQNKPIRSFIDDYEKVLRGRQRDDHYRRTTIGYIRDVLADSKATTPRAIDATKVLGAISRYRKDGKWNGGRRRKVIPSLETCNHYLRAVKAFSLWLWRADVLATDPLKSVSLFNADVERMKIRRAMTAEELRLLITTTETARTYGGKRWRLTGKQRALLYVVAACSGLRAKELASLTRSAFTVEDDVVSVTIKARSAKGKKTHRLPLPRFVQGRLTAVLEPLKPNDHVWPGTWAEERKGGVLMKRDAKRAGIIIANDDGESIDFHALRTSFITTLARSGVHPATAQRLARHSSITLTMGVYTKLEDDDLRSAVDTLPDPF